MNASFLTEEPPEEIRACGVVARRPREDALLEERRIPYESALGRVDRGVGRPLLIGELAVEELTLVLEKPGRRLRPLDPDERPERARRRRELRLGVSRSCFGSFWIAREPTSPRALLRRRVLARLHQEERAERRRVPVGLPLFGADIVRRPDLDRQRALEEREIDLGRRRGDHLPEAALKRREHRRLARNGFRNSCRASGRRAPCRACGAPSTSPSRGGARRRGRGTRARPRQSLHRRGSARPTPSRAGRRSGGSPAALGIRATRAPAQPERAAASARLCDALLSGDPICHELQVGATGGHGESRSLSVGSIPRRVAHFVARRVRLVARDRSPSRPRDRALDGLSCFASKPRRCSMFATF